MCCCPLKIDNFVREFCLKKIYNNKKKKIYIYIYGIYGIYTHIHTLHCKACFRVMVSIHFHFMEQAAFKRNEWGFIFGWTVPLKCRMLSGLKTQNNRHALKINLKVKNAYQTAKRSVSSHDIRSRKRNHSLVSSCAFPLTLSRTKKKHLQYKCFCSAAGRSLSMKIWYPESSPTDRQTDTHPGRADILVSLFALSIWLISVCRRYVLASSRLLCNLLHHLVCVFALFYHSLNALHFWLVVWSWLVVVHRPELDLSRAAVLLKSVQVPEVQVKW